MWKKLAIAGGVAAAVLGIGTAALAESGSPSPSPAAKSGQPGGKHPRADELAKLRNVLHAQWTTQDNKSNSTVTHEAIRGSVTSVSATSIAVKATDGVSETFAVNSSTKVRVSGQAKGSTGSISSIKTGDSVVVVGTGTGSFTATQVGQTPVRAKRSASPTPSAAPHS